MGACSALLQLAPVSLCKQGLNCYLTFCDWFDGCSYACHAGCMAK